jgi:hypothetical protein
MKALKESFLRGLRKEQQRHQQQQVLLGRASFKNILSDTQSSTDTKIVSD